MSLGGGNHDFQYSHPCTPFSCLIFFLLSCKKLSFWKTLLLSSYLCPTVSHVFWLQCGLVREGKQYIRFLSSVWKTALEKLVSDCDSLFLYETQRKTSHDTFPVRDLKVGTYYFEVNCMRKSWFERGSPIPWACEEREGNLGGMEKWKRTTIKPLEIVTPEVYFQ